MPLQQSFKAASSCLICELRPSRWRSEHPVRVPSVRTLAQLGATKLALHPCIIGACLSSFVSLHTLYSKSGNQSLFSVCAALP